MMREIGAVLDGGPGGRAAGAGRGRRARDPVRRGSRLVGTCEGAWWRPMARPEVRRVVLAAKRYELAGRATARSSTGWFSPQLRAATCHSGRPLRGSSCDPRTP